MEETGLEISDIEYCTTTNDIFLQDKKHYVTVFMKAKMVNPSQIPQVMEPDKCEYWQFVSFTELKTMSPLFQPLISLTQTRPFFNPIF